MERIAYRLTGRSGPQVRPEKDGEHLATALEAQDLILNLDPAAPPRRLRDAGLEAAFAFPQALWPCPGAWPHRTRPVPEPLTAAPAATGA